MESPEFPFEVESTAVAEADDLFGYYAHRQPENVVIYTQDKDMRMLPGKHLDWVSHRVYTVAPNTDYIFNEKQYGLKWFWLQMLHGDTADNIPGLPKYIIEGKAKPIGEITANKLLDGVVPNIAERVAALYSTYYGDRWLVEMMEQACLLWMRRVPEHWDDCLNPGGPLACFNDGEHEFAKAYFEIERRIRDADNINSSAAQVNGDSQDTGSVGTSTGEPVCDLPTAIV
jgi:DNA polymerase-1